MARIANPNGDAARTSTAALPATGYQRAKWGIQNAGTNVLNVHIGATTIQLVACTVADDGTGGGHVDESPDCWDGAVTVSGTNPRYNIFEYLR